MVMKLLRQAPDHVVVIVQGLQRFALRKVVGTHPYLRAEVDLLPSVPPPKTPEWEATFRNLRDSAAELMELTPDVPPEAAAAVREIEGAEQLVDFLAPNLNIDTAQKQSLLEELDVQKRVHAAQISISSQLEIARIQKNCRPMCSRNFPMRSGALICASN